MAAKKDTGPSTIFIEKVQTNALNLVLIGTRPLILNRMSEKVKGTLLMPTGRKTAAEKQSTLKHSPLDEYRASAYILSGGDTLLGVMSSALKGAMMTAALDLPGAKKAQIGRLVYVMDDYVPVYGIPELFMSITRQADQNHTPDVRTRAILPIWAAQVKVQYVVPLLNATAIVNLLSAGGMTAGIGDWRPEKGKGNYGQFEVTMEDDPRFAPIKKEGGRKAQEKAIQDPQCYDEDTQRLFDWYEDEIIRQGKSKS